MHVLCSLMYLSLSPTSFFYRTVANVLGTVLLCTMSRALTTEYMQKNMHIVSLTVFGSKLFATLCSATKEMHIL
jgi:hypothetical protein